MDRNSQFEIYKQALARLERRNQLIIKALRSSAFEQALEYATTPPDMIFTQMDLNSIRKPHVHRKAQLELDL